MFVLFINDRAAGLFNSQELAFQSVRMTYKDNEIVFMEERGGGIRFDDKPTVWFWVEKWPVWASPVELEMPKEIRVS